MYSLTPYPQFIIVPVCLPEYFEGVSLTTVILTPGACGGRLRAVAHDIDSAAPAEFSEIDGYQCGGGAQAQYLRACPASPGVGG